MPTRQRQRNAPPDEAPVPLQIGARPSGYAGETLRTYMWKLPEDDRPRLLDAGVAAVYTPKDFEIVKIMGELADLVERYRSS